MRVPRKTTTDRRVRQALYRGWTPAKIKAAYRCTDRDVELQRSVLSRAKISPRQELLTPQQAAVLLGMSPRGQRVRQLIKAGRIKAGRIGQLHVIERDEFLRFAATHRPIAGNAPKVPIVINGEHVTLGDLEREYGLTRGRIHQLIQRDGVKKTIQRLRARKREAQAEA